MPQPYYSPTGNLRDDFYLRYGVYPTPMTDTRTGMMNIAQDALQAGKFVGGMLVPQDMTDLGLMAAGAAAGGVGGLLATPLRRMAVGAGLMALDPNEAAAGPRKALQSLRGLLVDDATRIARRNPHLVESGQRSEGFYVGGPRNIQNRQDLTNTRRDFDRYVGADPRGGDWYDRYRAGVREVTGGDPAQNRWMAAQEGQWSAGVGPESEFGFALKENNASIAGMPVKSARPAQHEAHMRAVATGDANQYQLGKKTGEYAGLINPDRPGPAGATGVNDFRHARNFGYTDPSGNLQRDALTDAQHMFLDYETAAAVGRANQRSLGGRSDWTGEQLQAAPWVRQKTIDEMSRRPEYVDKYLRQGFTKSEAQRRGYEDAFADANRTIADFFQKHTAYATHEAVPGSATGHLAGSMSASDAEKAAYSLDPRSSWANAPGGRDAIYAGLGVPGTGNYMRVRPTQDMQGFYTNPAGLLETNPGQVARPLVSFDSGTVKSVSPADRSMLDAGEMFRAYVDAQNAGAWNKPWMGGQASQSNSVFMPLNRPATVDEMMRLKAATEPHGLPDIVDTSEGLLATRFYPEPDKAGKAALRDAYNARPADSGVMKRAKVDSGYADLVSAWQAGEGSGEATKTMLSKINSTPELRRAFDQNPYIPQNALARLERDAEYAAQWGATRADIQNARRIIGEGPGWVDRLSRALDAGALLPGVAAAVVAAMSEES